MKKNYFHIKIVNLLLLSIASLTIASCDATLTIPKSTLLVEEVKVIIDDWAPNYISHETTLPIIEGATIEFKLNNVLIESFDEVVKPLFDKHSILEAKIYGRDETKTYAYDMMLLSNHSPRHHYALHFEAFDMSNLSRDVFQDNIISISQNDIIIDTKPGSLRGRGNSSFFGHDKKSLKIAFETRVQWMGLRGNSFNLISMQSDKSLMRDALAHIISRMIGLESTVETRYVSVFQGGNYMGLYLLVEDRTFIDINEENPTLQFAVEVDQRIAWEGFMEPHIMVGDIPHGIRRPFNVTQAMSNQIKSYLDNTLNLIKQNTVPAYVDVKNWMQFLFIHELFKNVDAYALSIFLYQSDDAVLKFGPVWDFDLSLANADYVSDNYLDSKGFYLLNHPLSVWFKDTMKIPLFNQEFSQVIKDFYRDHVPTLMAIINDLSEALIPFARENFTRWDILNIYTWPNPNFLYNITFNQQTQFVKIFLLERLEWLHVVIDSTEYKNRQY